MPGELVSRASQLGDEAGLASVGLAGHLDGDVLRCRSRGTIQDQLEQLRAVGSGDGEEIHQQSAAELQVMERDVMEVLVGRIAEVIPFAENAPVDQRTDPLQE